MKKYIFCLILVCVLGVIYVSRHDLYRFYLEYIKLKQEPITIGDVNSYYRNEDFDFVKQTSSFLPTSKEDILAIYYTIINAGKDEFTFFCPKSYTSCIDDVKEIANNQTLLSNINNFVHPFNGFKNIETEYDRYGNVTVRIDHTYSDDQITAIIFQKKRIENLIWKVNMSIQDKIKAAHDYIINHTAYDQQRTQEQIIKYQSDTAYGALIEGYALCGGYTDAMALFLEDLNVKNFKVASEKHVWNAVSLNQVWYHIDLTWDDPIMSDGSERLEHNFFLVTTQELTKDQEKDHLFDKEVYREVA